MPEIIIGYQAQLFEFVDSELKTLTRSSLRIHNDTQVDMGYVCDQSHRQIVGCQFKACECLKFCCMAQLVSALAFHIKGHRLSYCMVGNSELV